MWKSCRHTVGCWLGSRQRGPIKLICYTELFNTAHPATENVGHLLRKICMHRRLTKALKWTFIRSGALYEKSIPLLNSNGPMTPMKRQGSIVDDHLTSSDQIFCHKESTLANCSSTSGVWFTYIKDVLLWSPYF